MKDDNKTKRQLVDKLTEVRSQNADLKNSTTDSLSSGLASEDAYRYAESIVETVREPLLVLDADLQILSANRNFYRTFKVTPGDTIGSFIYDLGNKQWDIPKLRNLLEKTLPQKKAFDDFEVAHDFKGIGHKVMLLNARRIYRKDKGAEMILLAIEDITERKRLENLLTDSEERFRRLFETASDGIVLLEKSEGKITHANPATEEMLGYTAKESIGKNLRDIGILLDMGDFQTTMQTLNEKGIINYGDVQVKTKSGQLIDTDIYLADRARLVQCNVRDITKRKKEAEALIQSEENLRTIFDKAGDGILIADAGTKKFIQGNAAVCSMLGYTQGEIEGLTLYDIHPPDDLPHVLDEFEKLAKGEKIIAENLPVLRKDGTTFYADISSGSVTIGGAYCLVGIIRDITERKRAEETLRESEKKYRLLADNSKDVIFVLDMNLNYTYISPSIEILRGYKPEEVFAHSASETLTPSSWDLAISTLSEVLELEKTEQRELAVSRTLQLEMLRKDGTTVWTEVRFAAVRDKNQQPVGILGVTRDIDDRKLAEEKLLRSETFLNKIIEESPTPIWISDENGTMIRINRACCTLLNVTEGEVVGTYNVLKDNIVEEQGFLHLVKSVFEEGRSVRFDIEYQTSLLKQPVIQREAPVFLDVTIFPIRESNGKISNAVFQHIDITERKRGEEERQRSLKILRESFETTIRVMVSTVEVRDPYTAGHQSRATDLARAIATEMKLPQDSIDGIRMAASIHDIGKLSVPAEILSKPTKLSELEFSLIKEHARNGYEILKNVESPWPLAQIVYQHHERMDGSGYPRNMKGGDILIESRILAVADVVEAMSSHRPYRSALGIDAALEEISKNRGTLYDPEVTDVCLRLFREKGYRLAEVRAVGSSVRIGGS